MDPFEIKGVLGEGGEGYSTLLIYDSGNLAAVYEWGYNDRGPYSVLYILECYKGGSLAEALIKLTESEWKNFKVAYISEDKIPKEYPLHLY